MDLTRLAQRAWRLAGRVALAASLVATAAPVGAQASGGAGVVRQPGGPAWLDMSNWLNWWPWRDTRPPPHLGVSAPHYGDGLFLFFQDRYFTALTGLMASQQFERLAPHDDEAEILRGGLFLSYGLHREAGEVFARLIERGAPEPVRDRAWFYLAKIRYQRGRLAEAEAALARIGQPLPGDLEEDRALLQANVLMAGARYAEAIARLDALAKTPGASSYVRYNLGVALVRAGDLARGTALLDDVGKMPASTDEFRSLRDQANLALGFAALQEQRGDAARAYLERVRLAGLHSNRALLGFGWAAAAEDRMKAALVPWTELATRDPGDAAVLEAKLAVPYAFAGLGADGQALALYQEAIAAFDREAVSLDAAVAAIRGGALLDALVASNPGDEMGWLRSIVELPEGGSLPYGPQLARVLASHPFQEGFKSYRDLQFLARNLERWQETLAVLRDMLANRRQAFAERLPQVLERERALNLGDAERRATALRGELDRVEAAADVAAFATARERELQVRLDRVRETLERAGPDPEFAAARERYRRAAGALLWHQHDQFPVRLWSAKKGLQALQVELAQAREADEALARAQRDEPARLDAFAARIDALAAKVDAMVPRVTALGQEQRALVQELAVAALLEQKERLVAYGTQARFAVAQIYDRASVAREGGGVQAR